MGPEVLPIKQVISDKYFFILEILWAIVVAGVGFVTIGVCAAVGVWWIVVTVAYKEVELIERVHVISSPKETDGAIYFSNLRESRSWSNSQLDFLQRNIIIPHKNKKVYRNSGLFEDKVCRGLILHGDKTAGIEELVEALGNEMYESGSNYVKYDILSKSMWEDYFWKGDLETSIEELFQNAAGNQPCLIFFKDVQTLLSDEIIPAEKRLPTMIQVLGKQMAKLSRNDEIIVILSVDKLRQVDSNLAMKFRFTKSLHLPKVWSTRKRKDAVIAATKEWENKPDNTILDMVADKAGVFLHYREINIEAEIGKVCAKAYRKGLIRYLDGDGVNEAIVKIRGNEIDPTREDWEEAVREVVAGIERGTRKGIRKVVEEEVENISHEL